MYVIIIMCKTKIFNAKVFVNHFDICFCIPVRFQNIMIATNQPEWQMQQILSPALEKIQFKIIMAMEKITYHDELRWLEMLDQLHQSLHISFQYPLWYRNTRLAEMAALAQVQIGKNQGFLFLPVQTFFGR